MPKRHLRETVAGEGAQIIPCLATIKRIPALVPEKFTQCADMKTTVRSHKEYLS